MSRRGKGKVMMNTLLGISLFTMGNITECIEKRTLPEANVYLYLTMD